MKKLTKTREKELKRLFIPCFSKNLAMVSATLTELSIPTSAYYRWLKEDNDFNEMVESIKIEQICWVESKLFQLIENNNQQAIIFYLKTKGRSAGYQQETTIGIDTSKNITFRFGGEDD